MARRFRLNERESDDECEIRQNYRRFLEKYTEFKESRKDVKKPFLKYNPLDKLLQREFEAMQKDEEEYRDTLYYFNSLNNLPISLDNEIKSKISRIALGIIYNPFYIENESSALMLSNSLKKPITPEDIEFRYNNIAALRLSGMLSSYVIPKGLKQVVIKTGRYLELPTEKVDLKPIQIYSLLTPEENVKYSYIENIEGYVYEAKKEGKEMIFKG